MMPRRVLRSCTFVLTIALTAVCAVDSRGADVTCEDILETVQTLAREKDLYAGSEFVLGLGGEKEIVEAFSNLVNDCYWKAKSIDQVLHFANAGIHYCLARAVAHDGEDDEVARALRFSAKRMATNAASFTWIGWEEPGVMISEQQMQHGLAMARYSVRQLNELDPTPAQRAYSYWFLAAHLIVQASYEEALDILIQARNYSKEDGGNPDGLAMLEGYIGLTKILSGEGDVGEPEFASAVSALESRQGEDAKFYAKQLRSVRAFFEKR